MNVGIIIPETYDGLKLGHALGTVKETLDNQEVTFYVTGNGAARALEGCYVTRPSRVIVQETKLEQFWEMHMAGTFGAIFILSPDSCYTNLVNQIGRGTKEMAICLLYRVPCTQEPWYFLRSLGKFVLPLGMAIAAVSAADFLKATGKGSVALNGVGQSIDSLTTISGLVNQHYPPYTMEVAPPNSGRAIVMTYEVGDEQLDEETFLTEVQIRDLAAKEDSKKPFWLWGLILSLVPGQEAPMPWHEEAGVVVGLKVPTFVLHSMASTVHLAVQVLTALEQGVKAYT